MSIEICVGSEICSYMKAVQENLMENQLLRAGESGLGVTTIPKTDSSIEETSVQ